MPFTVPTQSDARLLTAIARRLIRPFAWGVGGIMLLAGGVEALLGLTGPALIQVGLTVPAAWYFQRETARVAVERQRDQASRPVAVQFDTTGIRTSSGFQESFHPWSAVTRVEEWTGQIAVILGWRRAFGIATGGLTEEEHAAVLAVLHSRGTVQPA